MKKKQCELQCKVAKSVALGPKCVNKYNNIFTNMRRFKVLL